MVHVNLTLEKKNQIKNGTMINENVVPKSSKTLFFKKYFIWNPGTYTYENDEY